MTYEVHIIEVSPYDGLIDYDVIDMQLPQNAQPGDVVAGPEGDMRVVSLESNHETLTATLHFTWA